MPDGKPQTIWRDDTRVGIMSYDDSVINEDSGKQRQSCRVVNMYTLRTKLFTQAYKKLLGYVKMFGKHTFFCEVVPKRTGKLIVGMRLKEM